MAKFYYKIYIFYTALSNNIIIFLGFNKSVLTKKWELC